MPSGSRLVCIIYIIASACLFSWVGSVIRRSCLLDHSQRPLVELHDLDDLQMICKWSVRPRCETRLKAVQPSMKLLEENPTRTTPRSVGTNYLKIESAIYKTTVSTTACCCMCCLLLCVLPAAVCTVCCCAYCLLLCV